MITYDPQTHFPISDAANAFDYITDIVQVSVDEPKRLNMTVWGKRGVWNNYNPFDRTILPPACQTMACYAGWTVLMKKPEVWAIGSSWEAVHILLGSPPVKSETSNEDERAQWARMHADLAYGVFLFPSRTDIGTPEHVREASEVFLAFRDKYAPFLKARAV